MAKQPPIIAAQPSEWVKALQNANTNYYDSGTSVRTLDAPLGAQSYTMANLGQLR